jgi:hypothetical protein
LSWSETTLRVVDFDFSQVLASSRVRKIADLACLCNYPRVSETRLAYPRREGSVAVGQAIRGDP